MAVVARPEVRRDLPGLFVFLIDQSQSMASQYSGAEYSRSQAVAYAVNQTIHNLILGCMPHGEVEDYYHFAAIGYGGADAALAFGGKLEGLQTVPALKLAANPLRTETSQDADGSNAESYPVWITPRAKGMTPMCQALAKARDLIDDWTVDFKGSAPPIVLNITDGEANDGPVGPAAAALKESGTDTGRTLLFNLCITGGNAERHEYPATADQLTDEFGRAMFEISSELPLYMAKVANDLGITTVPRSRGFVYNGEMTDLVHFLTIGTQTANRR